MHLTTKKPSLNLIKLTSTFAGAALRFFASRREFGYDKLCPVLSRLDFAVAADCCLHSEKWSNLTSLDGVSRRVSLPYGKIVNRNWYFNEKLFLSRRR